MTIVPYIFGQLSCVGTSRVVSNRLLTCNRWFDSTTCLLTQSGLFTVAIVLLLACDDQLFFYSIATLLSVCMHTLNSTLQFHTLHTYVCTHSLLTYVLSHLVFSSSPHPHYFPLTHSLCICTYSQCTRLSCTHSSCTYVRTYIQTTNTVYIFTILDRTGE